MAAASVRPPDRPGSPRSHGPHPGVTADQMAMGKSGRTTHPDTVQAALAGPTGIQRQGTKMHAVEPHWETQTSALSLPRAASAALNRVAEAGRMCSLFRPEKGFVAVRASAAGRSSPSAAAPNSESAATRSVRLWKEVTPRELTRHHPVAAELLGLDDSSTPSVSGLAGAAQTHA
jgi:hypothetical protein